MMASLVERVSKMFIKPSSPTPQSLNRYNLSAIDQMMTSEYGSIALFYINRSGHEVSRKQLLNFLSKTLVLYYPFAGRLVENDYIYCNDQGIEFVEVRIHCPMYELLKKTRSYVTDLVFPCGMAALTEDSLVAVQLSHFDCGGVAIAVCISHKIADGSAGVAFVDDWAASTRLSSHVPAPLLASDSLFPRRGDILPPQIFVPSKNCVARRFITLGAAIEKLKSKAVEAGIQQPSRVEVVFALLYQCAMIAARSTNCGLSRPSVIVPAINLRPIFALPQNSVGNIFSFYFCINKDDKAEFPALVGQLRKARLQLQNLPQEKLSYESQMKELGELLKQQLKTSSFDAYICSSLCGFPINNIDFGWGKPMWTSMLQSQTKETIVLMDSLIDGVEALVTLEEGKMSAFENNELLLSFASLDSTKWNSKL